MDGVICSTGGIMLVNTEVTEFAKVAPRETLAARQPVRVLYLDDDEIDRTLMQMHVKRHLRNGVELHCVERTCEAAEALASNEYDYFVTDNRLPPVSTYRETLAALDLTSFRGRIIVVSSETRFDCFDSRPDDRIHCVTDKLELSAAIKKGLFSPF